MSFLYEVEAENRVVKGFAEKPIKGTQGHWYAEKFFYLADSEAEAEQFTREELSKRRFLGITARRRLCGSIKRQVKIINIRRLG